MEPWQLALSLARTAEWLRCALAIFRSSSSCAWSSSVIGLFSTAHAKHTRQVDFDKPHACNCRSLDCSSRFCSRSRALSNTQILTLSAS